MASGNPKPFGLDPCYRADMLARIVKIKQPLGFMTNLLTLVSPARSVEVMDYMYCLHCRTLYRGQRNNCHQDDGYEYNFFLDGCSNCYEPNPEQRVLNSHYAATFNRVFNKMNLWEQLRVIQLLEAGEKSDV